MKFTDIFCPIWLHYYNNLHGYNDVTLYQTNTDGPEELVITEFDFSKTFWKWQNIFNWIKLKSDLTKPVQNKAAHKTDSLS